MDDRDKQLLNVIQAEFPFASRPFHTLGLTLELAEREVIDRIEALKGRRIIRQISAIFDTKALGYRSSLVAARVPAGNRSTVIEWVQERRISIRRDKENAPAVTSGWRRLCAKAATTGSQVASPNKATRFCGATSRRWLSTCVACPRKPLFGSGMRAS